MGECQHWNVNERPVFDDAERYVLENRPEGSDGSPLVAVDPNMQDSILLISEHSSFSISEINPSPFRLQWTVKVETSTLSFT